MPVPDLLLGTFGRLLAAFERRRGMAVLFFAGLLFILGLTTTLVSRPPLLTPAVEGVTGLLLSAFSQPVRLARFMAGSRPTTSRLMQLELELASLRRAEAENRRLRAMLDYPAPVGYSLVSARIIGMDLDPLRGFAWIDAGRWSGFREGAPVLTVDGLVGIVDRAGRARSRIRLLVSETTPVSVRDTRSRALGVVEWDPGEGRLRVNQVPFQADFVEGDTLVSSGLGGVFPPDLPVGTVASVSEPLERLLKEVALQPFAAFHQLEEIFVLAPVRAAGSARGAFGDSLGQGSGGTDP
jgi:rod shape-determining protein MreC